MDGAIFVLKAGGEILVAVFRIDGILELHQRGTTRAACRFLAEAPFDGVSLGRASGRDGQPVELDVRLVRDVEAALLQELCAPMTRLGPVVGHA